MSLLPGEERRQAVSETMPADDAAVNSSLI